MGVRIKKVAHGFASAFAAFHRGALGFGRRRGIRPLKLILRALLSGGHRSRRGLGESQAGAEKEKDQSRSCVADCVVSHRRPPN